MTRGYPVRLSEALTTVANTGDPANHSRQPLQDGRLDLGIRAAENFADLPSHLLKSAESVHGIKSEIWQHAHFCDDTLDPLQSLMNRLDPWHGVILHEPEQTTPIEHLSQDNVAGPLRMRPGSPAHSNSLPIKK